MVKIPVRPLNTSYQNGGDMKKRLPNAYIRGTKVYVDYTLSAVQVKELRAKGVTAEAKRYRLATAKPATAASLKWVNENAYKVLENLLSNQYQPEFQIAVYGAKIIEATNSGRKSSTAKDFLSVLENYINPYFGKKELDEIRTSDLVVWQSELAASLSASRVKQIRSVLNQIFEMAYNDGIIGKNPLAAVKAPRLAKPQIEFYTLEEIKIILANCDGWFHNMVKLQFFSAMRTGEMMALEWKDVNFETKKIYIRQSMSHGILSTPKTHEVGYIDMLPPAEAALRDQYKHTGLRGGCVFVAPKTGKGFRESSTLSDSYWKPLIKRSGLHYIDFYNTRHSFATMMFSRGEDIGWISKVMLRHKTVQTTMTHYADFINIAQIKRASFLDDVFEVDTQVDTNMAQDGKFEILKRRA